MIYTVYPTSRFRKDAERAKKRGLSMTELEDVIDKLSRDEPLEIKHRDHKLEGGNMRAAVNAILTRTGF